MPNLEPDELVMNSDGSIYHLNLFPEEVAQNIILVGDPKRVSKVSAFFDSVTVKKNNREFYTHTGYYQSMPMTVISTGIGTDNIDIVVNELDALFNIDLAAKVEKSFKTNLRLVRIGTCGALQPEIHPGTPIISDFGLGFDNLAQFYDLPVFPEEEHLQKQIGDFFKENGVPFPFYIFSGSGALRSQFSNLGFSGITATCPGFYGPQGRSVRLNVNHSNFLTTLKIFRLNGMGIQNFEMETSALFALSRGLDHDCCSINMALANRETGKFLTDYDVAMDRMIQSVLDAWPNLEN